MLMGANGELIRHKTEMRTGAAILVRIVRKCALRATTKRLMHRAGSIVRSQARRKRRRPTAYPVLRSMPLQPEVGAPHSQR